MNATDFILRAQNADGGWGYRAGGMSYVEPTAAVCLALMPRTEHFAALERARALLAQLQHADGGWGIASMDEESGWMTAWAVWALASANANAAQRGVAWLEKNAGTRITDAAQAQGVRDILKIDPTITGWPWQPGDAAWIFPSALALLALDAAQVHNHPRVQEGIQYLLDRAIATGGWNIGNPFMLTSSVPPTVEGTALSLLALRAHGVENEITQRAQTWLAQENFTPTAFEWAWRAWYWTTAQHDAERARAALNALQRADGSWDANVFTTAIALMGLEQA